MRGKMRTEPATIVVKHTGNQGVVAGVLGCIFGIFGIFTFGLIFVPLAAICTIFGLFRGIAGRSVSGIGCSLLAGVLTVWGFVVSPSLWLLAGAFILAQHTPTTTMPATSQAPQQQTSLPASPQVLETIPEGHLCDPHALAQVVAQENPGIDTPAVQHKVDHLLYVLGCSLPSSAQPVAVPAQIARPSRSSVQIRPSTGWIGVQVRDATPSTAPGERVAGVVVASVIAGGPAAKAGIEPDDVITSAGGRKIFAAFDLTRLIRDTPAGEKLSLVVLRNSQIFSVSLIVGDRSSAFVNRALCLDSFCIGQSIDDPVFENVEWPMPIKNLFEEKCGGVGCQADAAFPGYPREYQQRLADALSWVYGLMRYNVITTSTLPLLREYHYECNASARGIWGERRFLGIYRSEPSGYITVVGLRLIEGDLRIYRIARQYPYHTQQELIALARKLRDKYGEDLLLYSSLSSNAYSEVISQRRNGWFGRSTMFNSNDLSDNAAELVLIDPTTRDLLEPTSMPESGEIKPLPVRPDQRCNRPLPIK